MEGPLLTLTLWAGMPLPSSRFGARCREASPEVIFSKFRYRSESLASIRARLNLIAVLLPLKRSQLGSNGRNASVGTSEL